MLKNDITFETGCYEKDYRYVLTDYNIGNMTEGWHYAFDRIIVLINNVKNIDDAKKRADKLKTIDDYFVVADYEDKALAYFGLTKDDFKDGWNYSATPLVGLYLCETRWLFHCTEDVFPLMDDSVWIQTAMRIIDETDKIFVANPIWDWKHSEAKKETVQETKDWYIGTGFSDQCYLIKSENKDRIDLTTKHYTGLKYPKYAGESFEKKMNAYMRNNGLYRITYKNGAYHHNLDR